MSYVYSELKVFFFGKWEPICNYDIFDWNQTEFPLPKYQTIPPFKNCWILLACIHTLTWQQGIQPFVAYHWRFCYNCAIASMQLWTPGESVHKQVEVEPFLLSLPGDVAISCELKKWIPKKNPRQRVFRYSFRFRFADFIVLRVYINSRMLFFWGISEYCSRGTFLACLQGRKLTSGKNGSGKNTRSSGMMDLPFFKKRSSHPENSHGDLVDQFTPKWIKATRSEK